MSSIKRQLTQIAQAHLAIPTLTDRRSDHLDFHEVAVWDIEQALHAAYSVGADAATATRSKIDVKALLAERRQVAIIWSTDDVQEMRPDLDIEQAWQVLQYCQKVHDCSVGFSWQLIDLVASDLFPQPESGVDQ